MVINIIDAYTPHGRLHENGKNEFWEQTDGLMHEIDSSEKRFIKEDLNAHNSRREFE